MSDNWICRSFFWMSEENFLETLLNNMWWCRGCLIILIFFRFWPQDSLISTILQLWSLESLISWPLKLTVHKDDIDATSSRQICNIFSWLEPLNYYPEGGNGDLQCFNYFLQPLSILLCSTILFCTSEIYSGRSKAKAKQSELSRCEGGRRAILWER